MICIKNNLIPFKGYKAINLFGIVFTREELNEKEKNHESIHTLQIIECAVLGFYLFSFIVLIFDLSFWWILLSLATFYIFYGLEYLTVRLFHKKQNDAYHDVSFEEEAYVNDDDLEYKKKRIPFNWLKYIRPKTNKK
jgi:amino acid transporter